jgi:aryl-alcohol dehydrogenase-like predicted oxidoreductase
MMAAASTARKTERVQLGNSGLEVDSIAIGAWSWNDRSGYWGQNSHGNYNDQDLREAFDSLADDDLTFIDTAEVYGFGKSEELIGDLRQKYNDYKPVIATKVAPLPWRFAEGNVRNALKSSLDRLKARSVALYQLHWPGFPILNNWATNSFVKGLAQVQREGLAEAVGVSNFKAERVREANRVMKDNGVNLASNQVQYSLLYRTPEKNGVVEACKETNTAILAYSPLTQGLLTGKYTLDNKPGGPRAAAFSDDRVRSIQPLLAAMSM